MSSNDSQTNLPHRSVNPSIRGGSDSSTREHSPRSAFLRAVTPRSRSRTASPNSRLSDNGELAIPRGTRSPISRTATPLDKALKHAAKTLQPFLKAMVAFATVREFEGKPSQYRLKQAEKKKAWVASTVCLLSPLLVVLFEQ